MKGFGAGKKLLRQGAMKLGGVGGPSKRWTGNREGRRVAQRNRGYRRMGAIGGAGAMMMGGRDSSPRTSPTPRSSGGMGYTPGRSSGGRM